MPTNAFAALTRSFTQADLNSLQKAMREARGPNVMYIGFAHVAQATARRMLTLEIATVEDYLVYLRQKRANEVREWTEACTTNYTCLNREDHPWKEFVKGCVPKLQKLDRPLKFWSAGCSHGCELFTMVLLMDKHVPSHEHVFIGTDMDQKEVWFAKWGRLSRKEVNGLPQADLSRYGEWLESDYWYASKSFTRRCQFLHRPVTSTPPGFDFDLTAYMFVERYLSPTGKEKALARVTSAVRVGGYLITDAFDGDKETVLARYGFSRLDYRLFVRDK